MKGKLYLIAGALAALLLIGYVGASFFVGSMVKAGVNRFAPLITRTPVHLDGARLSPLSGGGTLKGLFVGNPAGWSGDKAFFIGRIHVDVAPGSIFSECVVLNNVSIDSPEFVYETRVVSSNIGELLKNIEGSFAEEAKGGQAAAGQARPRKFVIRNFSLTNGRLTLGAGPTALTLPMPPLTLHDIGTKEGGIAPAALAFTVMRSVTGSIVSTTANAAARIVPTMGAAAGSSARSAGDALKELLSGKK